jgi:hypothetical protein
MPTAFSASSLRESSTRFGNRRSSLLSRFKTARVCELLLAWQQERA